MPPTVAKKPVSVAPPEPVPEQPIQGSAIVIIHPGSLNLQIGRAADAYPQSIPHCIAWRHKLQDQPHFEDPMLMRKECVHADVKSQQKGGLKLAEEAIRFRPNSSGEYRKVTSAKQIAAINQQCTSDTTEILSPMTWSNVQHKPDFLVGSKALYANPSDGYSLHWPYRYGQMNVRKGPGGSLTSVLVNLEHIWSYAIKELLDIPLKDLKHYRAVLLIPDIYKRSHVRQLMNLLLVKIGFAAAFVYQETVCASFGCGMLSACVVDIGDQKTSVCCVDDGLSQKNTRLTLKYGGRDVTRCFHWLLQRSGFPYRECDLARRMDALFLQDLKEQYCHMDVERSGPQQIQMQVKHPGSNIVSYALHLGDEVLLATMSLFFPDLFGLDGTSKDWWEVHKKAPSEPEDIFDDDYLHQTQSRQEQAAKIVAARKKAAENPSENPDGSLAMEDSQMLDDEDPVDPPDASNNDSSSFGHQRSNKKVDEDAGLISLGSDLLGIDQAILMSIDKCDSDEAKRKMYSCMIVVGGGVSKFQGAESWIKYAVWAQMPPHFRNQLETMDVITNPKEMDPMTTSWKGAAIISCMDTAQELWIRHSEWTSVGVRLLRERAPFIW